MGARNSPQLQQSLSSMVKAANGEVDSFLSGTQMWFDRQMDRVTGSYKRWAKRWVLVIAIAVVCIGNIDSIAIARALYVGGATRAAVVQQVTDLNFCSTPDDPTTCAEEAANFLQSVIPGLVGAQSPGWDLGLATEGPRLLLGWCGRSGRALLVSLARSDRLAAQHRTSTRTWLLAHALRVAPRRLSGYRASTRLA